MPKTPPPKILATISAAPGNRAHNTPEFAKKNKRWATEEALKLYEEMEEGPGKNAFRTLLQTEGAEVVMVKGKNTNHYLPAKRLELMIEKGQYARGHAIGDKIFVAAKANKAAHKAEHESLHYMVKRTFGHFNLLKGLKDNEAERTLFLKALREDLAGLAKNDHERARGSKPHSLTRLANEPKLAEAGVTTRMDMMMKDFGMGRETVYINADMMAEVAARLPLLDQKVVQERYPSLNAFFKNVVYPRFEPGASVQPLGELPMTGNVARAAEGLGKGSKIAIGIAAVVAVAVGLWAIFKSKTPPQHAGNDKETNRSSRNASWSAHPADNNTRSWTATLDASQANAERAL